VGRIYTVSVSESAQAGQVDFFELVPATGKPLVIHAWEIGQNTEVGDAAEESLALLLKRGSSGSTSGSGGATPTPVPLAATDTAAGFTAETMNTTQAVAGGGTLTTVMATAFNVRSSPLQWVFTPELRPVFAPAERCILSLGDAPADSITWSFTVWAEEIS
jgi:hypothetical protein